MPATFPLQPRMEFYDERGKRRVFTAPVLHRFLSDLFDQAGGESTSFEDVENKTVSDNRNKNFKELIKPEYVHAVSASYTTIGNEIISATAVCTITLNASPDDNEYVVVYHNAGNGVQISITDGIGTDILVLDQTVISYRYLVDIDQWVRGG